MSYTFKVITDLESMSLLGAAGLLWWRSMGNPTYQLMPTEGFYYKVWRDRLVSGGMTVPEDGKFCLPDGWWWQFAIREECDSATESTECDQRSEQQ